MSEVVTNELPDNWVQGQIKDLVSIRNGYAFKSKDFKDDTGVPVIRQTNLSTRIVNFNKPKYLPNKFLEEFEDYTINKDDVLIGLSGSIGNLSRYLEQEPALQNQRTGLLVEHVSGSIKYIEYYLQLIKKDLLNAAKGVAVQNISSKAIENWSVPIAPPEQQKRIIAKIEELFSHIDAGIEALNKAKQRLKQYRQSVLKAAVTGKLTKEWREKNKDKLEPASQLLERILKQRRQKWEQQQLEQFKAKGKIPKDDKWKDKYKEPETPVIQDVPELAEGWLYVRLDTLTDVKGGLTVDSNRKKKDTVSLPYLRVANVQRGFLNLTQMKEIDVPIDKVDGFLLKDRDILFNEGGDRDKLGRGWVWHNEVEPCTYQNHVFRARPYSSEIRAEFISIFGNTYGQEYFIKQGKQTTNLASINKTKLSAFPVPLCSKQEMEKASLLIEERVSVIDRTLNNVEMQLSRAETNKQSVLASAFNGVLNG